MSDPIHVAAPAKVNLGLAILGKRPDGYHDILSVFQTISWHDALSIRSTSGEMRLTCNRDDVPAGPDNLVWKTVELVRAHFGISDGVEVYLEKRIPPGSGLGGGSSDAAAAMRGLAQLWGLRADDAEWEALCAQIGSDVPFFWRGGTAVVTGRGERVMPLPTSERLTMLVVVPPVQVRTSWAYGQLREPFPNHARYRERVDALAAGNMPLAEFCRWLPNDFQPIVERHFPIIGALRRRLEEAGAMCAVMSGSGSAVFGIFEDEDSARRAHRALPKDIAARIVSSVGRCEATHMRHT